MRIVLVGRHIARTGKGHWSWRKPYLSACGIGDFGDSGAVLRDACGGGGLMMI